MKIYYTLTCLLLTFLYNSSKGQYFNLGKYDTLHSKIFNEDRRILVHVPDGAKNNLVRYPVMYLLDGENHFVKTLGILDHLSNTAGNELCPEMIVVAIFHPNRDKDLIPPASNHEKDEHDLFPEFLANELIPFVDRVYPTEPYKVLVGHSLGGLRVVNTLVYQPHLFNSYIALDPSLGMVKNWIQHANETYNKNTYTNQSLYIAMGMTMPKGMDTSVIIKDTSGNARHMRSIMTFAKNADTNKSSGLDFSWQYYPEETHQSVVFRGTYDGFVKNFDWFKNEKLFDIFNPEVSATESVKIITDYYAFLSKKMGYHQLPPEQGTSELIDYLNFKKWYDKALAFAQLNVQHYPSSQSAKNQLIDAEWSNKISLANLYPAQTADEIAKLVKQEALKKKTTYNISENAINAFAYQLMGQGKTSEAEIIFNLNVQLYPNSYNVYDSYGECLLELGREKEGIEAYQKSLLLNPQNSNATNILSKFNIKK